MGLVHSSPAEKVIRPRIGWQDCRRQLCLMGVTSNVVICRMCVYARIE